MKHLDTYPGVYSVDFNMDEYLVPYNSKEYNLIETRKFGDEMIKLLEAAWFHNVESNIYLQNALDFKFTYANSVRFYVRKVKYYK